MKTREEVIKISDMISAKAGELDTMIKGCLSFRECAMRK